MCFVQGAYNLAKQFHEGQKYGQGDYVETHLAQVALTAKMIAEGLDLPDQESKICEASAWLHDLIEDTAGTTANIREVEGMPSLVADVVWVLTKDRHTTHAGYLGLIVQSGLFSIITKLADSLCNYRACLADGNIRRALKYSANINYLSVALEREIEKRNYKPQ